MRKHRMLAMLGVFAGAMSPALAQGATTDANVYAGAGQTVFALIALALVLESGLALIFNWRPFVETFNARAVRPLVALVVALIVVFTFNLDLMTALINAVSTQPLAANSSTGLILTAMVIAGGSAGMNSLLVGLGFREVKTPETAPKPPPTKAWISVRALGKRVKGDIAVYIGKDDNGIPRVGTISGSSPSGWRRFFLIDRGRFPHYGGYELDPAGGPYSVALKTADGSVVGTWKPEKLGPGAIVDLNIALKPAAG